MSDAQGRWRECQAGEIRRMVEVRRGARHRRRLVRYTSLVGAVLALMLAVVVLPKFFHDSRPLSLNCRQVLRLARQYAAGTLEPELRAAVERHLEGCPGCREKFARESTGSVRLETVELASPTEQNRRTRPRPLPATGNDPLVAAR